MRVRGNEASRDLRLWEPAALLTPALAHAFGMTKLAFCLLMGACVVFAGCLGGSDVPESVTPTPSTPTTPPASEDCYRFSVVSVPAIGPAGMPRTFFANFTNCGTETLRLAHACLRGMDVRLLVLYNSTDPANATPPGVGPKEAYLVDNPIANRPLLCATAPPHVRDVPAGSTLAYAVEWSGLIDDPSCAAVECTQFLAPGRYLVAANAENAATGEAYIATEWITLT